MSTGSAATPDFFIPDSSFHEWSRLYFDFRPYFFVPSFDAAGKCLGFIWPFLTIEVLRIGAGLGSPIAFSLSFGIPARFAREIGTGHASG